MQTHRSRLRAQRQSVLLALREPPHCQQATYRIMAQRRARLLLDGRRNDGGRTIQSDRGWKPEVQQRLMGRVRQSAVCRPARGNRLQLRQHRQLSERAGSDGRAHGHLPGEVVRAVPRVRARRCKTTFQPGCMWPATDSKQFYIAGESYAGQHIPHIARAILKRNKQQGSKPWPLKGLLIGNGWISPVEQYLSYLPFAYEAGLLKADSESARRVEQQQSTCIAALNDGGKDRVDTPVCEAIMTTILEETKNKNADRMEQCVNMYDVRLRDDSSCGMNWPPDLKQVTPYLRRQDVINALHINPDKKTGWQECSGAVTGHFRAKNSEPAGRFLPELLAEVPILLFSGDKDMICNHLGTEAMIDKMTWNGGKGFELSPGVMSPKHDWAFEGEAAGTYQEARNLTYVVFYNSSHMVPFDYPRRTRDMLDRFLGVDIGEIGGTPAESDIDGEKGPLTSVGGHPNSTKAEEDKAQQLKEAEWKAYYRSGEVALVVVIIVAVLWATFLWRTRRRNNGYQGADGDEGRESLLTGMGLDNFRRKERRADLEAADFDERELDDLQDVPKKASNGYSDKSRRGPQNDSTFSLGMDSDDEAGSSDQGRRKE